MSDGMMGVEEAREMMAEDPVIQDATQSLATSIARRHERELERAYQLGLLHGINAQSMAQVERDVLAFEDYGWSLDE